MASDDFDNLLTDLTDEVKEFLTQDEWPRENVGLRQTRSVKV